MRLVLLNKTPILLEEFEKKYFKIGWFKKLSAKIGVPNKIFLGKEEGWKDYLPFYLAYCKQHKVFFLDYSHGYNMYLSCPICLKDWRLQK